MRLAIAVTLFLLALLFLTTLSVIEHIEPEPQVEVEAALIPPLVLEAPTTTVAPNTTSTSLPRTADTAPIVVSKRPAPAGEVADIIRAGFSRFGPVVAEQAVRVANCESTLNPGATNGAHAGLFQISRQYHQPLVARLGFTWEQMFTAQPNATVAAALYEQSGWQPWSCRWAA